MQCSLPPDTNECDCVSQGQSVLLLHLTNWLTRVHHLLLARQCFGIIYRSLAHMDDCSVRSGAPAVSGCNLLLPGQGAF